MTVKMILTMFDIDAPRPEQLKLAEYLAECSRIESALAEWSGGQTNALPLLLDAARRQKDRSLE